MKTGLMASVMAAAIVAGGVFVAVQSGTASPVPGQVVEVAAKVDNFQLTDNSRMHQELYYFKFAPAIVVMSGAPGSKFSQDAARELQKVADAYKDRGVITYILNSTAGSTREAVSAEMAKIGVTVPVLMDELQFVGESMGVSREGEVFVIDPRTWKVAYHGPIDDRFAKASPKLKAKAKSAYLNAALDSVIAGQPVQAARVAYTAGKPIAFTERDRRAEHAKISYNEQVVPVLQAKCVDCHQKGGIAPFAMDSYEKVKGFAPMIRESVRTERMPPYFADPHIGTFQHDQGLTAAEARTLIHWIEAGAPRGEGADRLALEAKEAPEWPTRLGKPDYVVNLPAFDVPASGIVEYQNQIVENPFKEDKWLRAVSIKPGDRGVLHHVVSNHIPDPKAPKSGIPGGSLGSYTPGAEAQLMAQGAGAPIPAGGKMYFQMHYTTTGKAVTDKTQVGFYFHDTKPEYIKRSVVISDRGLEIPANNRAYTTTAYLEFPADAYLYTLYPHAHLRGRHVELMAIKPDGTKEMMLSLPKYDFNWQRDYDPIEPILIKAGTKLVATWMYDNSKYNPANPDPSIDVTWGEQTHQEMMYFRVNYRWADETSGNIRNDLQTALMASGTVGGLDKNVDGLVQPEELTGRMKVMRARFNDLDTNKDGGLSKDELDKGGVGRFRRSDPEDEGL
jgi:hypothetical protein